MWVERGVAPNKIIATKYFNDNRAKGVAFQRPLCPYPQIARFDGYGRIADPSSFKCRAADTRLDPRNVCVQNAYK
jgi:feruloyl esterase